MLNFQSLVLQAVFRYASKQGLRPKMKDDENVRKVVKMAMALPLLPASQIREGFDVIRRRCNPATLAVAPLLTRFLAYIKRQWIDGKLKLNI